MKKNGHKRPAAVLIQRERATKATRTGSRKVLRDSQLAVRERPSARAIPIVPGTPDDAMRLRRVGRLRTVADWHKQVAKVYRAMRRGYLPKEDATRLTYVANIGAQLAKHVQDTKEIERIREQLEALKGGTPLLPPPEQQP